MNILTSSSNTQVSNIFDLLHDHENFTIDGVDIHPELVECAEHFVLACHKNPGFVSKIINADYDLIIGDDVSGRPITLMIKYIIDHYEKDKKIKYIFMYASEFLNSKYINAIKAKYSHKSVLICTEYIGSGKTIGNVINDLGLSDQLFDVFTQSSSSSYKNYGYIDGNNIITQNIRRGIPKIRGWKNKNIGLNKSFSKNNGFSGKMPDYDPYLALAYRQQIKLLSNYIIKNYLKT